MDKANVGDVQHKLQVNRPKTKTERKQLLIMLRCFFKTNNYVLILLPTASYIIWYIRYY